MASRASLVGSITEGPTPDEHGYLTFKVRVGDEVVIGVAYPWWHVRTGCNVGLNGQAIVVSAVDNTVSVLNERP